MKKSLVALAALATLGTAAFAQSSVTLYGRMDASLASQKIDNAGFNAANDQDAGAQIRSGAHTGSRWGLMGSEDLGGGLKANFTLEQGFNVDNGAASSANQFHRQAFVGLSGGFGAVTIGRQYDLIDSAQGNYDAFGNSGYSATGYAFNVACSATPSAALAQVNGAALGNRGIGDCVVRQNNAVIYSTPSMGGFTAKAMWAPGEDKTPAVSAGNHYGLTLGYTGGPLSVSGTYQINKNAGARAINNYVVGASYDFGAAKLFGMLEGGKNKNIVGGKDNGWGLGVTVPMGAITFIASYAAEDQKAGGVKIAKSAAFGLMGQYALSKRTYVYAAYRDGEVNPTAAGLATEKQQSYGLGLVHLF